MEFSVGTDGKGQYRVSGDSTWIPFLNGGKLIHNFHTTPLTNTTTVQDFVLPEKGEYYIVCVDVNGIDYGATPHYRIQDNGFPYSIIAGTCSITHIGGSLYKAVVTSDSATIRFYQDVRAYNGDRFYISITIFK